MHHFHSMKQMLIITRIAGVDKNVFSVWSVSELYQLYFHQVLIID